MNKIAEEINNIKKFHLKDYYRLVKKYSEKEVVSYFKNLLVEQNDDLHLVNVIDKYDIAYIIIEMESLTSVTEYTYTNLCKKYGENNVNNFIIEWNDLGENYKTNKKLYDNINTLIDNEENFKEEDKEIQNNESDDSNYSDDATNQYFKMISQIPLLSSEEEKEIFEHFTNETDEIKRNEIRNKIAESNLRLVVNIAKRYCKTGGPILDIIQNGNIGLMKAIDKYDYKRGYKFGTYATWWIKQSITRAIYEQSRMIRLPVHVGDYLKKIAYKRSELFFKLKRNPTSEELAESVGISVDRLDEIITSSNEPISLQVQVGEDEDTKLEEFIPDEDISIEDKYFKKELKDIIMKKVLPSLTEREADIIKLRFGLEDGKIHTLEEVGKLLGITRERARQIEKKTTRKLIRNKELRDYRK